MAFLAIVSGIGSGAATGALAIAFTVMDTAVQLGEIGYGVYTIASNPKDIFGDIMGAIGIVFAGFGLLADGSFLIQIGKLDRTILRTGAEMRISLYGDRQTRIYNSLTEAGVPQCGVRV